MKNQTENQKEEQETELTCPKCGDEIGDEDSSFGVETSRGKYEDLCEGCARDLQHECKITGEEIDPAQVSRFVVIKTEAASTMNFLPGIYRVVHNGFYTASMIGSGWMNRDALLFVAPLPKPDESYDISGHISRHAALPYAKIWRQIYGHSGIKAAGRLRHKGAPKFDKWSRYRLEKSRRDRAEWFHARKTVLENPDMIRDLECDPTTLDENGHSMPYSSDHPWEAIKEYLALPELPTYHKWIFVEHRGVTVYYAGYKSEDSWMTLREEPRFRSNGHGPECFSISGLPNWGKHKKTYVNKRAKETKKLLESCGGEKHPLAYYEGYVSSCDMSRSIAKEVLLEAIEQGHVTPDKVKNYR